MIFIWWLFFVDYGLFVGFLWVVSVGFRWGFFWLLFLFFLLNDKTQFCFFFKFFNLLSHFLWSRVWPKLDCKGCSCTSCKETMWSQTWSYLRSWDLTLPHTILNCKIYIKADKRNLFHWISYFEWNCIFCLHGLTLLKLWEKLDLSQGPSCGACQLCQPPWGLAVPSWEGCGARACKPLWGRGSWHHRICGSGTGCQATRAPFFCWKRTRFLNTEMLH